MTDALVINFNQRRDQAMDWRMRPVLYDPTRQSVNIHFA